MTLPVSQGRFQRFTNVLMGACLGVMAVAVFVNGLRENPHVRGLYCAQLEETARATLHRARANPNARRPW